MSSTLDLASAHYSSEDLATLINLLIDNVLVDALGIKRLSPLSADALVLAIERGNEEIESQPPSWLYFLTGRLQGIACEYLENRAFETTQRAKGMREILDHIAQADLQALPASIRDQLIPWHEFSPLRSTLSQIRQNAASLLKTLPERGALPRKATFNFVDQLADFYEEVTGRRATKVGRDSPAKHSRKRSGRFYRFVLAALKPIDPGACSNIHNVIDAVIDTRCGRSKTQRGRRL